MCTYDTLISIHLYAHNQSKMSWREDFTDNCCKKEQILSYISNSEIPVHKIIT